MAKDYHCCATCIHFRVIKEHNQKTQRRQTTSICSRLRYETKSHYKFNCWQPKEHVQQLIDKASKDNMK